MEVKKYDGLYEWTPTSEAFFRIIKKFIKKEDKILEFGSSTGHISYRLAKEGYDITLLDIRKEPIETAQNNFKKNNIKANFICNNIFSYNNKYDMAWNSGLIQCYDDSDKDRLIKKLVTITNKILLFYPDVDNPNKKMGTNEQVLPGVGNATEYSIRKIPDIVCANFTKLYQGTLEMNNLRLEYDMYWIYAEKE